MIITGKELSKMKEVGVYYGVLDDYRMKERVVQFDGVMIFGVHKIMVDGMMLRLLGKKGKEKGRICLRSWEGLDVCEEFGEYKIR